MNIGVGAKIRATHKDSGTIVEGKVSDRGFTYVDVGDIPLDVDLYDIEVLESPIKVGEVITKEQAMTLPVNSVVLPLSGGVTSPRLVAATDTDRDGAGGLIRANYAVNLQAVREPWADAATQYRVIYIN